ncbi:MAG: hypothetical protein FD152_786, partial [Xanthobacteraceae bacterium]
MMHRVVKPFPCSWDGFTLVDLVEGDERDFGAMANGLRGLGWIEPIDAPQQEPPEPAEDHAPAAQVEPRHK